VTTSFNEQFGQYGAWRREFALRLKLLSAWMKEHDLLDAGVQQRLDRLTEQMRSDKVMVAFVAEFSRGKSELINAIFFASYGRRIMPAGAGRTTMCPTELGYDPAVPPCLRLLPVGSRRDPRALSDWRQTPEHWTEVALDVHDPAQLATALSMVAEIDHVTREEARTLGFWHDELPDDNPLVDAAGLVQVPRWRHALVNIAHPLLQQGLVILDTPGLNAVGAEPELTVNLIHQAHAVVFILAADTGVTKSDMAVWREHLSGEPADSEARLVVLNKIDTLWDAMSQPETIAAQIAQQRASSAAMLGVTPQRVMAVSAQKGLLAKVSADGGLLRASGLPVLENVLAEDIVGQRQAILRAVVARGIADLRTETSRIIHMRRRELAEQKLDLQGLGGKNTAVIKNMRQRIEQEKHEFDVGAAKVPAVRAVQHKLLGDAFVLLGSRALKSEMHDLGTALRKPGLKLGVKRVYADTFAQLRSSLDRARAHSQEIQSMLAAMFTQLNAEYGFSLQPPAEPDLQRFYGELSQIEGSHVRYLGLSHTLKLGQPEFVDRLVRALNTRVQGVYESAFAEIEIWSKSASAQLEAQLKERRTTFGRRLEAIDRIQQAAGGLDSRVNEIESQEAVLGQLETRLQLLTSYFLSTSDQDNSLSAEQIDAAAHSTGWQDTDIQAQ
jgi:hypothetical protein